jgi:hypothetical protein
MTDSANESAAKSAVALLIHYGFEHGEFTGEQLIRHWLSIYPARWIRLAIIEALYQGRYKTISVQHILIFWQRREQPLCHFNQEFERLVCHNLPKNLLVTGRRKSTPSSSVNVKRFRPQPQVQQDNSQTSHTQEDQLSGSTAIAAESDLNPQNQKSSESGSAMPHSSVTDPLPQHPTIDSAQVSSASRIEVSNLISELPPTPKITASSSEPDPIDAAELHQASLEKYPIHQFMPDPEPSEFYAKLTAIASAQREAQARQQVILRRRNLPKNSRP